MLSISKDSSNPEVNALHASVSSVWWTNRMRHALVAVALTSLAQVIGIQQAAGQGDCQDSITIPHEFVAGTPAKASEVNANFDAIVDFINGLQCEIDTLRDGLREANLVQGELYVDNDAFQINSAAAVYEPNLDSIVFSVEALADAGSVKPLPAGSVDGAPVLGYVFLTTLTPEEVGFGSVTGTVGLAITSHPDFDDTPLWDEDNNQAYDDDGVVYHSHWVVLGEDDRAPTGLAVLQNTAADPLPPTAPMAMYLDSPGFAVIEDGNTISVIVPLDRVRRNKTFEVSAAVTAFMQVDASAATPLLTVEKIYDSEALSGTPITNLSTAPDNAWPATSTAENSDSLIIESATVSYVQSIDTLVFAIDVAGAQVAVQTPVANGSVDGAPVLGYVFLTSLTPETVGFKGQAGTLALAVTTHPDFDDTPLWDENFNGVYDDAADGAVYHVHWVVLVADGGSIAGLSVPSQADTSMLPPTAPMTMYLDSPGFNAFAQGDVLRVVVPAQRVNDITNFDSAAVTADMTVDASGANPVLRVDAVRSGFGDVSTDPITIQSVNTAGDL